MTVHLIFMYAPYRPGLGSFDSAANALATRNLEIMGNVPLSLFREDNPPLRGAVRAERVVAGHATGASRLWRGRPCWRPWYAGTDVGTCVPTYACSTAYDVAVSSQISLSERPSGGLTLTIGPGVTQHN